MKGIFLFLFFATAALADESAPGNGQRVKVAEGESVFSQHFTAGEKADTFREETTWTLWRAAPGTGYEVEESTVTTWGSSGIVPRQRTSQIRLSPDLHAVAVDTVENGSVVLSCVFAEKEAKCVIGGRQLSLANQQPYDLYGNSAWFYASIVRRAARDTQQETKVRLILVDNPPGMAAFEGKVRYLGEETLTIDGRSVPAEKYRLDARYEVGVPLIEVWVSREGIPLRYAPDGQAGDTIVRLRKFSEF
jgi:hypothetical protein